MLRRGVAGVVVVLLACLGGVRAHAQDARPVEWRFEVASIRPASGASPPFTTIGLRGGQFRAVNVSLRGLIAYAYDVRDGLIAEGDGWIRDTRWEVIAKAESPPDATHVRQMVQRLLADRFALSLRREARDVPVYALVMARQDGRLGPHLRPSKGNCLTGGRAIVPGAPPDLGGSEVICGQFAGSGTLKGGDLPMSQIAAMVNQVVDRPVIDRTGLNGRFDFSLAFATQTTGMGGSAAWPVPDASSVAPDQPSVFTALKEQLGLELTRQTARLDVLVVDGAQPPSNN